MNILSSTYTYKFIMSFTRFHDDPARIKKHLQESTEQGEYMLNVPGNGLKPCYIEDPYIRMQKWGANLQTNCIHLESTLRGMDRKYNRDHIDKNNYKTSNVKSNKIQYPVCKDTTQQPRASNPAWTLRGLEQVRWDDVPLNPQQHIFIPFHNNLNTRILEKDHHVTKISS